MRIIAVIAILLIASSCEKDLELSQSNDPDKNLNNYLLTFSSENISEDLFAYAGKSTVFERQTPNFPVHIYSVIPKKAQEIRIYSSDSIQYPDSLELFVETEFTFDYLQNGFFTRFLDSDTVNDRIIRICYQSVDSLHISAPITMNVSKRNTSSINGIIREVNSQGYLSFDWSSAPATAFHFLTMSDRSDDLIFALRTGRSDFSFYDLRFADSVLFQAETNPELQLGLEYDFSVYSISSKGWLNATASNTFSAE